MFNDIDKMSVLDDGRQFAETIAGSLLITQHKLLVQYVVGDSNSDSVRVAFEEI